MSAPAAPRKLIQIKHALAKSTQCLSWEGGHAGGLRRSGRTSVRVNSRPAVIHAVEIADLVTPLAGVRVLEGPQARCSSAQGDLPSQERRSWPERRVSRDLKALAEFETSFWGQRYPAIAQSWQRNWEHVVPFFAYPESVRRIIYTSQLQLLRLLQRGYRSGRHRCSRKSEHA